MAGLLCVFCGGSEEISGVCRVCLDAAKGRIAVARPVLTSPVLQARDLIFEGLMVRKGYLLTEAVGRERANNIATALIGMLIDGALPATEQHEDTAIGLVRSPTDDDDEGR